VYLLNIASAGLWRLTGWAGGRGSVAVAWILTRPRQLIRVESG